MAGHLRLRESVVGVEDGGVVAPGGVLGVGPVGGLLEQVVVGELGVAPVGLGGVRILAGYVGQREGREAQRWVGGAGVFAKASSSVGEPDLEKLVC